MKKERTLELKKEVQKEWESCFGQGIDANLNTEGLAHYWDDNTSVEEAMDMLSIAAVGILLEDALAEEDVDLESLMENLVGVAIISRKEPIKKETDKSEVNRLQKFKVVGPNFASNRTFTTMEGAMNFREDVAKILDCLVEEFDIVKVVK